MVSRPGLSIIVAALMALAWVAANVADVANLTMIQGGMIPARLAGSTLPGIDLIPAWLTPLTSVFVHAGLLHLVFNGLMLVYCGQRVEAAIGWRWLALLLVAGAYGAAVAELLWNPNAAVPIVGASGAIAAVIAMYAMLFSEQQVATRWGIPGHVLRAMWLFAAWVGLQLLIGIAAAGQVAVVGHVGGFAAGLLLSRPILNRRFAVGRF